MQNEYFMIILKLNKNVTIQLLIPKITLVLHLH